MKPKDLRERSVEDLRELEKSLAKDTFQNRFKNFTNRLDDTSSINKARRDLARVKTLLRERDLLAADKSCGGESAAAKPAKAKPAAKAKAAKTAATPAKTKTAKTAKKSEAK